MSKRGFSLIELLVVIAIIGSLITLAGYSWSASSKRSRDNVRKTDLSRMSNALQQYYLDNRAYPDFDYSQGNTLVANWLLAHNTGCPHSAEKVRFLTPIFLNSIPQDPKKSVNFSTASCSDIRNGSSHYLYLAGPRGDSKSPSKSPREFILMATLEANQRDQIPLSENPVATHQDGIFNGYNIGYGDNPYQYDSNYMVRGQGGR